jgi:hypothetical protein
MFSLINSMAGAIGALSVNSLSIGDNAVTVPSVAILGSAVSGTGANVNVLTKTVVIDTTGLAGKTISSVIQFVGQQGQTSGSTWFAQISIGGTNIASFGGTTFQPNFCAAGLYQFTANGTAGDGFTATAVWGASVGFSLTAAVMTVTSAKR